MAALQSFVQKHLYIYIFFLMSVVLLFKHKQASISQRDSPSSLLSRLKCLSFLISRSLSSILSIWSQSVQGKEKKKSQHTGRKAPDWELCKAGECSETCFYSFMGFSFSSVCTGGILQARRDFTIQFFLNSC